MNIAPQHLRLEASSNCQLKCPSCPTAAGTVQKTLGGGFLTFANFKKIVQASPQIKQIELSNWGEIFLNPEILDIIKYAHEHNVFLTAENGSNLNTVKEEVLEAIAKYRFRVITCSIDGASQETYSIYRKNGDFNKVIDNIKKIVAYKKKYQTPFPILTWQFVAFEHNKHEINIAKALSQDLGMNYFFTKISWDKAFSPIQDVQAIKEIVGSDIEKQDDFWMGEVCSQLWTIPQVNWDGRVLGCCVNTWEDYGNAFDDGLEEIFNGEKMSYARQMVLGEKTEKKDIPCTSCWHYKSMKKNKTWLKMERIEQFKARSASNLSAMSSEDLSQYTDPQKFISETL